MQLAWWTRVWTVQELVLAKNGLVIVGSVSVPWDLFSDFCQSYSKHLPPGACCHSTATWKMTSELWDDIVRLRLTVWSFYSCRLEKLQPRTESSHTVLLRNLWLLRHKAVTDHRDKIYGLLGLLHGQKDLLLLPDYSISTAEAFARCTEALIKSCNSLGALLGPRLQQPGLPSWVMDFLPKDDSPSVLFFQNIFRRIASSVMFNACCLQELQYSTTPGRLNLHGFAIDKIKDVAIEMGDGNIAETLHSWECLSCSNSEDRASAYPMGCSQADAFWRTMVRDAIRDYYDGERTRRAKAADEASYLRFRSWLTVPSNTDILTDPGFANFRKSFFIATQYQNFFTTCKGYIGLGYMPQLNDEIWILFGGNVPFILRPYPEGSENSGAYTLVGDCYVHGVMDGEAMEHWKEKHTREISLV